MSMMTEPEFTADRAEEQAAEQRVIELRSARDAWSIPNIGNWTRLMFSVAPSIEKGKLTIVLPDGRMVRSGSKPGRDGTMVMKNERVAKRLLTGGSLSFAESYMDDDWESPDIGALTEWACQNESLDGTLEGKLWFRVLRRALFMLARNSRRGSRRNIAYHYDLGNSFYAQWLDPGMTYSSGLYQQPGQSLEAAQDNKFRRLVGLLDPKPGQKLLEIGSGWGGFACFAARERGCDVHGITISREQYDYARKRAFEAGLAERVTFEMRDYRDVEGQYDGIASVEMFEAVGEAYWPTYFSKIDRCLKPGGRAALQVIAIADKYYETYRASMDFIQKYIFPGGMLPSPSVFRREAGKAGLVVGEEFFFRHDYAETLLEWRKRFMAAWPVVEPMGFDERFRRMWEYYLAYCEGGFRGGTIDVMQVALAHR